MSRKEIKHLEEQVEKIRAKLQEIGEMRPGSLTRQYRKPQEKKGCYWQISYTHRMRGHSEHVRKEYVAKIRKEIAMYKRFKKLTERWVELSLRKSILMMKEASKEVKKQ